MKKRVLKNCTYISIWGVIRSIFLNLNISFMKCQTKINKTTKWDSDNWYCTVCIQCIIAIKKCYSCTYWLKLFVKLGLITADGSWKGKAFARLNNVIFGSSIILPGPIIVAICNPFQPAFTKMLQSCTAYAIALRYFL